MSSGVAAFLKGHCCEGTHACTFWQRFCDVCFGGSFFNGWPCRKRRGSAEAGVGFELQAKGMPPLLPAVWEDVHDWIKAFVEKAVGMMPF